VRLDARDSDLQQQKLLLQEIEQVFFDVGRTGNNRPSDQLDAAIAAAGDGGELAITKLSRLARSLPELAQVMFRLTEQNITLRVGPSSFDLRTADQLLMSVIRVAADFDTDLAAQRATEGWRTARGGDHLPGRKPTLTPAQEAEVVTLNRSGTTADRLATQFGVGRSTIYRVLARRDRPLAP
jgi:DNA invertase Pin-like site-specific DNA recombinase